MKSSNPRLRRHRARRRGWHSPPPPKLITSKDIKDGTIKSADIKNGTIKHDDVKEQHHHARSAGKARFAANSTRGPAGPAGPAGPGGPKGRQGDTGRARAGRSRRWSPPRAGGGAPPACRQFTPDGVVVRPVHRLRRRVRRVRCRGRRCRSVQPVRDIAELTYSAGFNGAGDERPYLPDPHRRER